VGSVLETRLRGRRAWLVVLLAAVGLFSVQFALTDYRMVWERWGVATMPLPFGDLRTVTGAGESLRAGHDPLVHNPGEAWDRPMNYPRAWLLLSRWLEPGDTVWLAAVMIGLMLGGLVWVVPRDIGPIEMGLMLGLLFSPAVLLCVERGNSDLAVFALTAAAVALVNRAWPAWRLTGAAALSLAVVLKLYPACGLLLALRARPRVAAGWLIGGSIAVVGYAWWIRHDLGLIAAGTQQDPTLAYGLAVVRLLTAEYIGPAAASWAAAAAGALVLAAAVGGWWQSPAEDDPPRADAQALDAMRVGAGVYVGTFLVGMSFDYRLIFLLLAVPQLARWAPTPFRRGGRGGVRGDVRGWVAVVALAAALMAVWRVGVDLPVLAHWGLAVSLAWLLGASLPAWLRPSVGGRRQSRLDPTAGRTEQSPAFEAGFIPRRYE
jgi:hypothetical protein